ncbi:MAG: L-glutamate gamma-semialdehyde dehydrogenase, partial [Candidatus Aminicenantales bacterium]
MGEEKGFKVTYTTLDPEGLKAFHQAYDRAVGDVLLYFGNSHPLFIGGREVRTVEEFEDSSPINRDLLIGKFQKGTTAELNIAVDEAFVAFKSWRDT